MPDTHHHVRQFAARRNLVFVVAATVVVAIGTGYTLAEAESDPRP